MQQMTLFPELAPTPTGRVYFATDGSRMKIGFTSRPVRRRGGELSVVMLYSVPGSVTTEREFHQRWAQHRIGSSEWFYPAPALMRWLWDRLLESGDLNSLRMLRDLMVPQAA